MSNIIQLFKKKEPQPTRPDWWLCHVPTITALMVRAKARPMMALIKEQPDA